MFLIFCQKSGSTFASHPIALLPYLSHSSQTPEWNPSPHPHHLLNPHLSLWLTSCPSDDPPPPLQIISYLCRFPPTQASSSLASLRQVTGGPPPIPEAPHSALSPSRAHTHTRARATRPPPPRQHWAICRVSVCWCGEPSHLAVTQLLLQPFTCATHTHTHTHLQLATQSATMCVFECGGRRLLPCV